MNKLSHVTIAAFLVLAAPTTSEERSTINYGTCVGLYCPGADRSNATIPTNNVWSTDGREITLSVSEMARLLANVGSSCPHLTASTQDFYP